MDLAGIPHRLHAAARLAFALAKNEYGADDERATFLVSSAIRDTLMHLDGDTMRQRWAIGKLVEIYADPYGEAVDKLAQRFHGENTFKARIGDLRFLYTIDGKQPTMIAIGPRGSVYKDAGMKGLGER